MKSSIFEGYIYEFNEYHEHDMLRCTIQIRKQNPHAGSLVSTDTMETANVLFSSARTSQVRTGGTTTTIGLIINHMMLNLIGIKGRHPLFKHDDFLMDWVLPSQQMWPYSPQYSNLAFL